MIHLVFAIYDEKANAYLPPFFLHRPELAIRAFTDCVTDPKHRFGAHPADYTLYQIADYDDSNAELTPYPKKAIITGLEARASVPIQSPLFDANQPPTHDTPEKAKTA